MASPPIVGTRSFLARPRVTTTRVARSYRVAKQAVTKALQYAYIGRKQKKRQFRALWIVRINAAARQFGMSYSRLMNGLKKANITVDRKVLADIAVHDIKAFGALAEKAKAGLARVRDR